MTRVGIKHRFWERSLKKLIVIKSEQKKNVLLGNSATKAENVCLLDKYWVGRAGLTEHWSQNMDPWVLYKIHQG